MRTQSVFKTFLGSLPHRVLALLPLAALVLLLAPSRPAEASFDLSLTHVPQGTFVNYSLAWTPVDPSTDTAVVTYYVFEEFGRDPVSSVSIPSDAIFVTQLVGQSILEHPGSRCFVVASSDSVTGAVQFSDTECHGFVHSLTQEGITRADGDGTQRGVDQRWTFTYSLDSDAYVTARIYPPGSTFTFDTNGFITQVSSPVVKTLVQSTPRSGELANHTITMQETWDSRTSSGQIVGNGIYYLVLSAALDTGYPLAAGETYMRDAVFFTIPVDILRIMNLTATGITPSEPTALISYDITGDANVRVVIAKPGSGFVVDSNGLIQAFNLLTHAIDSTLVVSSFTYQRKAGTNIESWDGTSATGTVLTSGVYPVGISASDEYGNYAIDNSSNDFPIFTTITLERTAGSESGGETAADSEAPTVATISPASGSATNSEVTTITVQFTDSETGGSAINLSGCAITVRDPSSSAVPGTTATSGTDSLVFTPTTALRTSGSYVISVTVADTAGNSATYAVNFSVNIRLDSSALESSTRLFPNPAKSGTTNIRYALSVDATTEIEVFNILGERVYNVTYSDTNSSSITHAWNLTNSSGKKVGSGLYLVKVTSTAPGSKAETIKKLVVVQ